LIGKKQITTIFSSVNLCQILDEASIKVYNRKLNSGYETHYVY